MALDTNQYGYLIDPLVPITDANGTTIKDGFIRVYIAGSSTPVITYRNFDESLNEKTIELDNSGRCKYPIIVNKSFAYKVVVYDAQHSQETPIITVDKMFAIGASVTVGADATVVTGLDGFRTKPDGFVDASVIGTDGYVALDHTIVEDDLDTDAKVTAVEEDRYIPLLNEDVNDPDSKITLGRLWKWVLGSIKSLSTSITAFRTGDVIPVDGPDGPAKMSKDDLLRVTAQNAAASGLVATAEQVGKLVVKKANESTATINYKFPANVQLVIIVECDPQYTGNVVGSILYDDGTRTYPSVSVNSNGRRLYTIDVSKSGVLEAFNLGSLLDKDLIIKVGVRTNEDHQRQNLTLNEDFLEKEIKVNAKDIASLDNDLGLLGDNVAGVVGSFVTQLSITKTEHYYIGSTGNSESYYSAAYTEFSNVRKGDTFSVRCWSGSDCRAWLVKKSNGSVSRLAPIDAIFNTYHDYDLSVTIADDEDGGTLVVNTLKRATIECRKVGAFPAMGNVISDFDKNPLVGKIAVFDGDSICEGESVGSLSPYYKWGWAGRIGNRNLMNWKNYGIGGGTLCCDTYTSAQATEPLDWVANDYYTKNNSATTTTEMWVKQTEETWDGHTTLYTLTPRHWESKNIDTIYAEYPNADYVILEACLNDGFQSVPIGTLEGGYDANFEPNTWYRALQWTFKRAFELFPNAKIGIIIPHKIQFISSVSDYLTIVEEVARKWNVPCLNLYTKSGFNFRVDESRAVCNSNDDGIHLTDAGYEMIYHKILSWMKSL